MQAILYRVRGANYFKGIEVFQKSCDLGSSIGCANLANVYYGDDEFAKIKIPEYITKAKAYIKKAVEIATRIVKEKKNLRDKNMSRVIRAIRRD